MDELLEKDDHKAAIRPLEKRDFPGMIDIFKIVFDVKIDESYLEWKYFKNPYGEHIMYVAHDGERVVGETGAFPVKFKCGKESFMACQGCDIAVLPDYKKRGTFLKLFKLMIEGSTERGLTFMYGFTVPTTSKISSKLFKFRPACSVKRWVLILNPAPYLSKKLKIPLLVRLVGPLGRRFGKLRLRKHYQPTGDKIVEIHRFDERFDRFWEERKGDYEIMVVRDSTYLNWRYTDNPMKQYKVFSYIADGHVKGFIVLTTAFDEVHRGIIMDIMVDSTEKRVVDCLLTTAIDYFYREKMDSVMFWLPEHIPLVGEIEKWGFVHRDTNHTLTVRVLNQPENWVNFDDYLKDPRNWYFTLGDSDYY
jgi:predicted N-acetyltransferase YhbS